MAAGRVRHDAPHRVDGVPREVPRHRSRSCSRPRPTTLDAVKADPAKAKATANAALKALTGKTLKPAVLDRALDNLTLTLDPIASTLQASADHGVEVGTTKKADLYGIYDLTLLNALLEAARRAAGVGGRARQGVRTA